MSSFRWTPQRTKAAISLADGASQRAAAKAACVNEATVSRWMDIEDFASEVDRLTVMMGIAGRAERLRIAKRIVKQRVDEDGVIASDKDLLDWLKFAQSETDGIKLDLAALAEAAGLVADGGSPRPPEAHEPISIAERRRRA